LLHGTVASGPTNFKRFPCTPWLYRKTAGQKACDLKA
jgi:hypothetical protein